MRKKTPNRYLGISVVSTAMIVAGGMIPVIAFGQNAEGPTSVLPGDADWGTTRQCNDSDFVAATGTTSYLAQLLSRHTYCAKFISDTTFIYMNVMLSADGKTYVPYKKSAGLPAETCTVGSARFVTQFQTYGKGASLKMPHSISVKLTNFSTSGRTANCPATISTIVLKPSVSPPSWTSYYGNVSNLRFSFTAPSLSMSLANGSNASASMDTTVAWDSTASVSVVSFRFYPESLEYAVDGAESQTSSPWKFYAGGASGDAIVPAMRCDKNGVKGATSGCALNEAAAVFVVDSAAYPEAAAHVREAMAGTSPGMAQPSPGGFALKAGTRAVVDDNAGSVAMQRANSDENDANRSAACSGPAPLVETRPVNNSASCTASTPGQPAQGCSCDEYPFASTRSGGAFNPGGTSVKYILLDQNKAEGRSISAFFNNERVIFYDYDNTDRFWVVVK